MTTRELARLGIRLLAIIAILLAITVIGTTLPFVPQFFSMSDILEPAILAMIAGVAIGPLLMLGAALFLWIKAGTVAAWMTGHDLQDDPDEPEVIRIDARLKDIHAVAFSIIGLWTLITIIPELAQIVSTVVVSEDAESLGFGRFLSRHLMQLILSILPRIVLGVWLLFGGRGLVDMLHRVRRIGLEPDDPPPARG